MEYSFNGENPQRVLSLAGKIGFGDHRTFQGIIEELMGSGASSCIVDLSALDHIDSAGLGLLIVLNDSGQAEKINISVRGAHGQVEEMLELTNFSQIMNIE